MDVNKYKIFFSMDKSAYNFLSSNPYKDCIYNECYSAIYDFYKRYREDERNNGMRLNRFMIKSSELYLVGYDDSYENENPNNTSYFFWLASFKYDFEFEFSYIGSCGKLHPLKYGFDLYELFEPINNENNENNGLFFVNEEAACVDFILPIPIKVKKLIEIAYKSKL